MKLFILLGFVTLAYGFPGSHRIVGGREADISEAPCLISFRYFDIHFCGGSLITKKIALTAAHCTDGLSYVYRMSIRAGSNYEEEGGVVVNVTEVIQHENYNDRTYDNDISMLYLEQDVTEVDLAIKPVPIDLTNSEPLSGKKVSIYGWGDLYTDGPSPTQLMTVTVETITREECRDRLVYKEVTDNMICAFSEGKDSCQGDSGGPLIDENGVQVGIVSWGIGCAFKRYPAMYTNIAALQSWIQYHKSKGPQ